jgi:hypothetical protein
MHRRASVDAVGTALLATLGFLGACGGGAVAGGEREGGGGPTPADGGARPGTGEGAADSAAEAALPADALGGGEERSSDAPATCTAHPCVNPMPIVVANVDTGYDTCESGTLRRRAVVDCPSLLPRASVPVCSELPDGGAPRLGGSCGSDQDCTANPNGYCQNASFSGYSENTGCSCNYGCARDSDCYTGAICVCADPVGYCTSAACNSSAICLAGCDCVAPPAYAEFACQTPEDTCISDKDCVGGPTTWVDGGFPGGSCGYTNSSECAPQSYGANWGSSAPPGLTCQPGYACGTGRPFLVDGAERLAPSATRSDWCSPGVKPDLRGIPNALCARLAAYWTRVALMEHASIAAFARFTLHLLAVGAPPDLVSQSQQAMADETQHAKLAFALATAYGAAALGPGPLAIEGSLDGFDVSQLTRSLIREGCIGETVAAIEARDALEGARDPAVRRVLETVARDELRHAELAWRALRWLVSTGRTSLTAVRQDMAIALAEAASTSRRPDADAGDDMSGLGVVSDARRDELRRAAVTHVIDPCVDALTGLRAAVLSGAKRKRAQSGLAGAVA